MTVSSNVATVVVDPEHKVGCYPGRVPAASHQVHQGHCHCLGLGRHPGVVQEEEGLDQSRVAKKEECSHYAHARPAVEEDCQDT